MIDVAIVTNGVVVNIVVFEDEKTMTEFPYNDLFGETTVPVPLTSEQVGVVGVGFTYQDGAFNPPVPPAPTHEELLYMARREKYDRISRVSQVLTSGPLLFVLAKEAIGESSEEQKEIIRTLISYYEQLEPVDITTDPANIQWPVVPDIVGGSS